MAYNPVPELWKVTERYSLDIETMGGETVILGCRNENDARLIAQAPAMLVVLRKVVNEALLEKHAERVTARAILRAVEGE